jgi:FkbM family methyltransferase
VSRFRSLVKAVLPAPLARWIQQRRAQRERRAVRGCVVTHTYGGRMFEIELRSLYGKLYDQDWPKLAEIERLKRHGLVSGARVFNLGANHGVIALMLADAVGQDGQVIAVEADPDDAEAASSNAARNGMAQLTIINAAVAHEPGWIEFGVRGAVDHGDSKAARRRVAAVSIDELAARFGPPDVVFMDVEGYEAEALAGATATLARAVDWFVEVHDANDLARYGASAEAVLAYFDAGFELWAARDGLRHAPTGELVSSTEFRQVSHQFEPPSVRFFLLAIATSKDAGPARKLDDADAV